jgi:hypothetical protein
MSSVAAYYDDSRKAESCQQGRRHVADRLYPVFASTFVFVTLAVH